MRVIYAEGEDERVLRAVQTVLDDGLARPTLIGRPQVIAARVRRAGLRFRPGEDVPVVDPENDPRFREYWTEYHALMRRRGVTPEMAKAQIRRSTTTIGAIAVRRGDADAMLCGMVGRFDSHLENVRDIIGPARGHGTFATLNALMLPGQTLFVADTFVNDDPTAEQVADIAAMAAATVRDFGLPPKVAFLSHSMFGSSDRPSARKMRAAHALFTAAHPEIECDGEMHGDAALSEEIRRAYLPETTLAGAANVLVMPNLDSANILFNVLKVTGGHGVTVGPILLGAAASVHIMTPSATVRRIVNMTALAGVEAGIAR
jgi:malate dehydrogenase (oxaloacetate-decarboxylating)(NADP+)